MSGGAFGPAPEDVFRPDGRTARRATPLWPFLLASAILLFVLDVALRRIDFGPIFVARKFALARASGPSYNRRASAEGGRPAA